MSSAKLKEINQPRLSIPRLPEDYPLDAIRDIRKLTALPIDAPIQEVINSGVAQQIIKLLQANSYNFGMLFVGYFRELDFEYVIPDGIINGIGQNCEIHCIDERLQVEGRCILSDIAAEGEEQAQYVVDIGAVPILIEGIKENMTSPIQTYSFAALGNIANSSKECRDLLLSFDIIQYIENTVNSVIIGKAKSMDTVQLDLLQGTAFCLQGLFGHSPVPALKHCHLAIDVLLKLTSLSDEKILRLSLRALYCLRDVPVIVQRFHTDGLAKRCIDLLDHDSVDVREAAIFVCITTAAVAAAYTNWMISHGTLDKLKRILKTDDDDVKEAAVLLLATVCAAAN